MYAPSSFCAVSGKGKFGYSTEFKTAASCSLNSDIFTLTKERNKGKQIQLKTRYNKTSLFAFEMYIKVKNYSFQTNLLSSPIFTFSLATHSKARGKALCSACLILSVNVSSVSFNSIGTVSCVIM